MYQCGVSPVPLTLSVKLNFERGLPQPRATPNLPTFWLLPLLIEKFRIVWLYIGIALVSLCFVAVAFVVYVAFNLPEDVYFDED
jgi:hypothetical protein